MPANVRRQVRNPQTGVFEDHESVNKVMELFWACLAADTELSGLLLAFATRWLTHRASPRLASDPHSGRCLVGDFVGRWVGEGFQLMVEFIRALSR